MLEENSNLHLRKIQICFYVKKNSKFASKEDINVFLFKNSDLHLRKIQICFYVRKKFRFASKEDTDQFLVLKKKEKEIMC